MRTEFVKELEKKLRRVRLTNDYLPFAAGFFATAVVAVVWSILADWQRPTGWFVAAVVVAVVGASWLIDHLNLFGGKGDLKELHKFLSENVENVLQMIHSDYEIWRELYEWKLLPSDEAFNPNR